MVPTREEEVDTSIVGMDDLVLGSVEDGVVDREHGSHCQDLLRTAVPGAGRERHGSSKRDTATGTGAVRRKVIAVWWMSSRGDSKLG